MKREESRFAQSCIFEGMVSFRALIRSMESGVSGRRIIRVIYDKSREKKIAGHLSYIKAMSFKYNFEVQAVTPEEIENTAIGTSHGGILIYTTSRELDKLSADKIKPGGFYVMLDGIEDPYNFGYAVRSVYASGADGIILSERNWMSAAGVVCRSSAGASEEIGIFVASPEDCIDTFKKAGYKVACADIENSVSVYDADMRKPVLLVVGGEKRGLSRYVCENADITVRLDYGREFNEALSAASAASILAFEVFRQSRD